MKKKGYRSIELDSKLKRRDFLKTVGSLSASSWPSGRFWQ
jgi:hypothetical protein